MTNSGGPLRRRGRGRRRCVGWATARRAENWKTLKVRAVVLGIATNHFDPYAAARGPRPHRRIPLEDILTDGSTYNRGSLKQRLYETGLKERRCEVCGQDELWRGGRMALILDHANGVRDDNRLENLRIVCPNCAATLETQLLMTRAVGLPGPRALDASPIPGGGARYVAVGRKYGVSDNAIRKWLREYEQERLIENRRAPEEATIPVRTWPNRRREADRKGGPSSTTSASKSVTPRAAIPSPSRP